ncbi:MAG: hypothetical protein AB1724_10905 [Thermodesulfobacteriota bacterium]
MGIIDDLAKEIRHEIDALEEGEFGEALIGRNNVPVVSIEKYLNPEPDVLKENESPSERLECRKILGLYMPMSSPGRIYLSARNLRGFFWSLVHVVMMRVRYISKNDLVFGFHLVTLKTYHHELFHFYCDVLRAWFGGTYDALTEEALAVAWARIKIARERQKWQAQIGRMNPIVFNQMMFNAFNYTSPGYRDWPKYADEAMFKQGVTAYLSPPNNTRLLNNGVDVDGMLYALLNNIKGGYVEAVL